MPGSIKEGGVTRSARNIAKQSEEQQKLPPESPASAAGIKPASKAGFYRKHAEEVEARLAATQRELADLRHMAEVEEAEAQEEARLEMEATEKEAANDARHQVPSSSSSESRSEAATLRAQRDGLAAQLQEAARLTEDSLAAKASEVQRLMNTTASLSLDLGTARHERDAARVQLAIKKEKLQEKLRQTDVVGCPALRLS